MRDQFQSANSESEDVVVAISPEEILYCDYESIPRISRPSFLMLKEETIIADGWLIRISPTEEFMEFLNRACTDWKDWTKAGDIQLTGFLDALETAMVAQHGAGEGELDGALRSGKINPRAP